MDVDFRRGAGAVSTLWEALPPFGYGACATAAEAAWWGLWSRTESLRLIP